jgi:Methyltransferase domain
MNAFAELFRLRERRQLRELGKTWKLGMTSRQEQQWLRTYAARNYRGNGAIVDLGCFLGATTIAFAEGLALNRMAKCKRIHAYDLFTWNKGYEAWANGNEVEGLFPVGGSFLPEFLRRTEKWRRSIAVHEGDLRKAHWEHGPIEFLFIDAMKTPEVAAAIASEFFPHLVPGKGYVAHQDFPHCFTPWVHFLTFRLRNYFSFVADLPQSSLFRLKRKIAPEILASELSPTALSPAEIEAAFDYSMRLVGDDKKANVIAAKAMAYAAREEFTRAHEIVTQSRYGPASRANEFNTVKASIERNLTASTDFL